MFYLSLLSATFISIVLLVFSFSVLMGNIQGLSIVLLCLAIDLALARIAVDSYKKDHKSRMNSWFLGCGMVLGGGSIVICGLADHFSALSVLGLVLMTDGYFISRYNNPNLKQQMRKKAIANLKDEKVETKELARELLVNILTFINTPNGVDVEFKLNLGIIGRYINELIKKDWELSPVILREISNLLDSYIKIFNNSIQTERSVSVLAQIEENFKEVLTALNEMYDRAISQEINEAEVQMKVLQNHLKSKGFLDDFDMDNATLD